MQETQLQVGIIEVFIAFGSKIIRRVNCLILARLLSGSGTIDYDVEVHTLDAHKTFAARREFTTKNSQKVECLSVLLLLQSFTY